MQQQQRQQNLRCFFSVFTAFSLCFRQLLPVVHSQFEVAEVFCCFKLLSHHSKLPPLFVCLFVLPSAATAELSEQSELSIVSTCSNRRRGSFHLDAYTQEIYFFNF